MDRLNERLSALAAVLSLGCAMAAAVGLTATRLGLLLPLAVAGGWSAWVALWATIRARLARRAEEERQAAELERREQPGAALFSPPSPEEEPFSIARTRAQFERFAVPAAPLVAALPLGSAAAALLMQSARWSLDAPLHPLGSAAWLAGQGFVLLIFGRYLAGLARERSHRLLRGPAGALSLLAAAGLVGAAAALGAQAGLAWAPRVGALALAGLLALLAAEGLARFVMEIYRPRRPDDEARAPYESGLGAWLAQPGGWLRGAASSLNYQFGFKVSETWFYRFLESALLPFTVFQALVIWLLTCLVFIGPDEAGILERFGRPRAEAAGGWRLDPGAHVKWPWPFEQVRRYPAGRVLTTAVGFTSDGDEMPAELLWTRAHFRQEDMFLTPSREGADTNATPDAAVPVNLLSFSVPIEYRIRDLRAYAYGHADPAGTVRHLAYRSLTRETASRDLFDILGEGQETMAGAVRSRLQDEADRIGLGIDVLFVGLQGVHPPIAIADAFESVIGATEEKESAILGARAHEARQVPAAEAGAAKALFEAEAYAARRRLSAEAETVQFRSRRRTAAVSPAVFRNRYQTMTLRDALRGVRLYVVAADVPSEVIQFNFEEKIPSDLFDWSEPASPPVAPEKKP